MRELPGYREETFLRGNRVEATTRGLAEGVRMFGEQDFGGVEI